MDFIFILHFEGIVTANLSCQEASFVIISYFHWRAQCTTGFQVYLLVFLLLLFVFVFEV